MTMMINDNDIRWEILKLSDGVSTMETQKHMTAQERLTLEVERLKVNLDRLDMTLKAVMIDFTAIQTDLDRIEKTFQDMKETLKW